MELQELIRQGEGERLEFKKKTTHPTRIARTLSSLANTHGGRVLVGVDDDGRVVGVRDAEEEIYQLRQAAAHYIDPPLTLRFREVEEDGRVVVVVTVPESSEKPHRAQVADGDWRAYVRVRDESVQSSQLTERVLQRQAAAAPRFERLPLNKEELAVLDYLRKNARITLAQYMKLLNIGQRRAFRTLIKLTLHGYIRHHDKEREVYYTL
ncbi:AlbA family DNA-binding domain-containing protein [Hymenobacter weizhouensis]|uniref:AlbA family DNA-binding domain-containing protein n=1 Tax=Hymenobacter sp. YIM 151500-1 TaxID=2987689 RepID=UPI0022260A0C|nr:RNA-binding domain-containing protein [Hymenobacter sp. YIM 151500-1]UYZ63877.1 putative DNA binding domain-containing protein [Hymenobacter sp. YIM 151500-1]